MPKYSVKGLKMMSQSHVVSSNQGFDGVLTVGKAPLIVLGTVWCYRFKVTYFEFIERATRCLKINLDRLLKCYFYIS